MWTQLLPLACALASHGPALPSNIPAVDDAPVRVFILAGQSNMEGFGQVRSLPTLAEWTEHGPLLARLQTEADGELDWAVRDDVHVCWPDRGRSGPLTVGWGHREHLVGPELMFGTLIGDASEAPVLLIKTAWGGKDVYCDFRSPSAGEPAGDAAAILERERERGNEREVGHYYRKLIGDVESALAALPEHVPGAAAGNYELEGLLWFQGWNDYIQWRGAPGVIDSYGESLALMFKDLRAALDEPELPIYVGEMGIGGTAMNARAEQNENDQVAHAILKFRGAQQAACEHPDVPGVTYVPTAQHWDDRLDELNTLKDQHSNYKRDNNIENNEDNELPTPELSAEYRSRGGHWYCHYNGSGPYYCLVGYEFARAVSRAATPIEASGARR
jgi:alpha-galactosidase